MSLGSAANEERGNHGQDSTCGKKILLWNCGGLFLDLGCDGRVVDGHAMTIQLHRVHVLDRRLLCCGRGTTACACLLLRKDLLSASNLTLKARDDVVEDLRIEFGEVYTLTYSRERCLRQLRAVQSGPGGSRHEEWS